MRLISLGANSHPSAMAENEISWSSETLGEWKHQLACQIVMMPYTACALNDSLYYLTACCNRA